MIDTVLCCITDVEFYLNYSILFVFLCMTKEWRVGLEQSRTKSADITIIVHN